MTCFLDLHVHTDASDDGRSTLAQMAAAALHAGSEVCKRRMEGQSRGGALKTVRFAALLCRRPISRM